MSSQLGTRCKPGKSFLGSDTNPILDSRTYEVEFPNGEATEYSANVIAKNMFAQFDMEGNQFLLMSALEWKDSSTTWERLADLKESYPIEVAEHTVT